MLCSASTKWAGKEFVTKSVDSRSLPSPSPRSRITPPGMHPDISSYVTPLSLTPCDDSLKTVFVVNGACLHQRGKCVPYRRILYGTHVSYILPFAFVRARISTYKRTPAQQKMPQNFGGWGGNLVLIVMDGAYMVINRWPQKKKKSFQIQRSRRLFYFFNLRPL